MQRDDPTGKLGMKIGRDLMEVAGRALRANVTVLAPRVLPASEQLLYAGNIFARKAGSGVVHGTKSSCSVACKSSADQGVQCTDRVSFYRRST